MTDAERITASSIPDELLSTDMSAGADCVVEETLLNPGCITALMIDWVRMIRPPHRMMTLYHDATGYLNHVKKSNGSPMSRL